MLNRCFPYQRPLQILAILRLLLIKSTPRHKRANILIRQGSGKKNNPRREGASPPPLLRLLLPPEGGDKRSRRTYRCEDKEQLVKMVDDKHNAPCGWRNNVRLPAHWVAGIHHSGLFARVLPSFSPSSFRMRSARTVL